MSLKDGSYCVVCGKEAFARFNGNPYCKRHYLQMYRHGRIYERTIYDANEYIIHSDYAEVVAYDNKGAETGRVKIDLDKVGLVKQHKLYIRKRTNNGKTRYAMLTINGKKIFLHRFLLGLYGPGTPNEEVDHINGDKLDNRLANLRICSHQQNLMNIRKDYKFVGVKQLKNGKWTASIMYNYKAIFLGNYDCYEDAVKARLNKEKELFGEYGGNKELYSK